MKLINVKQLVYSMIAIMLFNFSVISSALSETESVKIDHKSSQVTRNQVREKVETYIDKNKKYLSEDDITDIRIDLEQLPEHPFLKEPLVALSSSSKGSFKGSAVSVGKPDFTTAHHNAKEKCFDKGNCSTCSFDQSDHTCLGVGLLSICTAWATYVGSGCDY